jgi:hypothetical protein
MLHRHNVGGKTLAQLAIKRGGACMDEGVQSGIAG